MLKSVALIVALTVTASLAFGDPTINVGTNSLQANAAGQIVNIYITGGDSLQNVDFSVQIGDGGTAFGGTNAPKLTNINLFPTAGLFASNNTGRASGTTNGLIGAGGAATSASQIGYEGTTTALDGSGNPTYVTPPVSAPGALLAQLTIDTTGFTTGTWALLLTGTLNGDTAFMDDAGADYLPTAITNGTITLGHIHHNDGILGDFNNDGTVNDGDYTVWADNFNPKDPSVAYQQGQGTNHGYNDGDYTNWADGFGKQLSNGQPIVPEPATMSLLGLGLMGLLRNRRK